MTLKAQHIAGWLNGVQLIRLGQTEWFQKFSSSYATGGTNPGCLGSRCTQSALGGPGPICHPTSSHSGQSSGKTKRQPMQDNHSDCSSVAQHVESSNYVWPDPFVPTQPAQSADTVIQSDLPQESVKYKAPCPAPRVSAIKEQGFSETVAAPFGLLKESQPGQSMKQSGPFLQNGAKVISRTSGYQSSNP